MRHSFNKKIPWIMTVTAFLMSGELLANQAAVDSNGRHTARVDLGLFSETYLENGLLVHPFTRSPVLELPFISFGHLSTDLNLSPLAMIRWDTEEKRLCSVLDLTLKEAPNQIELWFCSRPQEVFVRQGDKWVGRQNSGNSLERHEKGWSLTWLQEHATVLFDEQSRVIEINSPMRKDLNNPLISRDDPDYFSWKGNYRQDYGADLVLTYEPHPWGQKIVVHEKGHWSNQPRAQVVHDPSHHAYVFIASNADNQQPATIRRFIGPLASPTIQRALKDEARPPDRQTQFGMVWAPDREGRIGRLSLHYRDVEASRVLTYQIDYEKNTSQVRRIASDAGCAETYQQRPWNSGVITQVALECRPQAHPPARGGFCRQVGSNFHASVREKIDSVRRYLDLFGSLGSTFTRRDVEMRLDADGMLREYWGPLWGHVALVRHKFDIHTLRHQSDSQGGGFVLKDKELIYVAGEDFGEGETISEREWASRLRSDLEEPVALPPWDSTELELREVVSSLLGKSLVYFDPFLRQCH